VNDFPDGSLMTDGRKRQRFRPLPGAFQQSQFAPRMRGAVKEADKQLKDAQLFRQQAFIDGAWVDADFAVGWM